MKGQVQVVVFNGAVRYEFLLRRNLTIIRGDSATGKTTLVELIREYYEAGEQSGIHLSCEKNCRVLDGRDWKTLLAVTHDSVVFIDDENGFVRTAEFAEAAKESDNYFVIVTRVFLPNLPYSVNEIYGIRSSGRYAGLRQVYHELYHIYPPFDYSKVFEPELVVVEDSNAGYEFYHALSEDRPYRVISAEGKTKIPQLLRDLPPQRILIIADGAAFGPEMARTVETTERRKEIALFLPESFEWMVLRAGLIQYSGMDRILDSPADYIESSEYFSWEQYFTALLTRITQGTWLRYSKRSLNPAYKTESVQKKILKLVQKIQL